MNVIDFIGDIIVFVFVIAPMTVFIFSSIFFIRPMKQKYKIMVYGISDSIYDRYGFIILFGIFIWLLFKDFYEEVEYNIFLTTIIVYVVFCMVCYFHYKKYDILEYIDSFSKDLFDWDSIYTLDMPEEIKKECFAIHSMSYENYSDTYMEHLEGKIHLLECLKQAELEKQGKMKP